MTLMRDQTPCAVKEMLMHDQHLVNPEREQLLYAKSKSKSDT